MFESAAPMATSFLNETSKQGSHECEACLCRITTFKNAILWNTMSTQCPQDVYRDFYSDLHIVVYKNFDDKVDDFALSNIEWAKQGPTHE